MIVMNKDGNLFDERRKSDRRVCKRRDTDLVAKKNTKNDDRRKNERRVENINKK